MDRMFFFIIEKVLQPASRVERSHQWPELDVDEIVGLLSGLVPHTNPKRVFASDYYKNDFLKYAERLGIEGVGFRSLIPKLYFPAFLQESLHYRTHAMVSLPVLNPRTILNHGFDTYRLMEKL